MESPTTEALRTMAGMTFEEISEVLEEEWRSHDEDFGAEDLDQDTFMATFQLMITIASGVRKPETLEKRDKFKPPEERDGDGK